MPRAAFLLLACLPLAACDRGSQQSTAADARAAQVEQRTVSAEPAASSRPTSDLAPRFSSAAAVDPDVVIAYTASAGGFLQPCGCALKDKEMGGVARRATLVDSLEAAGAPVLLLEAGDFVGGAEGTGPRIAAASIAAMEAMGYDAMAVGEAELALGEPFLKELAGSKIPLVHTNWSHPAVGEPQRDGVMVAVGPHKIGLIGLLDPEALPPGFGLENLAIEDPAPAAERAARSLREAGAEAVVVLGHASFRRSGLLGPAAGTPDLWVVGHGGKELSHPAEHEGVLLLGSGNAGKMVGILDVDFDEASAPRYAHRLYPLPESMRERPDVAALVEGLTPPAHWGT